MVNSANGLNLKNSPDNAISDDEASPPVQPKNTILDACKTTTKVLCTIFSAFALVLFPLFVYALPYNKGAQDIQDRTEFPLFSAIYYGSALLNFMPNFFKTPSKTIGGIVAASSTCRSDDEGSSTDPSAPRYPFLTTSPTSDMDDDSLSSFVKREEKKKQEESTGYGSVQVPSVV
jgi:hypothetical protein